MKSGKRALSTDPVVIAGPVSNEELAACSNIELTSGRWHASRQKHREGLIKLEGEERFEGLQKFFSMVH